MAYAIVREFPHLNAEEFDRLRAEIGEEPSAGLIVHVAGPSESGWRTIDIWETKADSERYEHELLAPALGRAALDNGGRAAGVFVHHLLHGDAG